MVSAKSKKKNIVTDKHGVQWVVDDNGNKIKKFRKKIRRRNSTDNNNTSKSFESSEFGGTSSEDPVPEDDFIGNIPDGKMISFRTAATEKSSSHDSLSISERMDNSASVLLDHSGAFSTSSKKSPRKSKNIVEIDGQLWRTDAKGNPINKVRRKSGKANDRLSTTEHGPLESPTGGKSTPSKKNKKSGSKSVRHFSHSDNIADSSDEDHQAANTVDTARTSGTGSVQARPKPRRSYSQPQISLNDYDKDASQRSRSQRDRSQRIQRPGMKRQPSGDLDMLMSQSVHDHTRRVPRSAEKPKLGRQSSTVGKVMEKSSKGIGKTFGKIFKGKNKDKEKDRTDKSADSGDKNLTMRSLPEDRSSTFKPLPKGIREIDGVLWRVDELGNKINKVRKKGQTASTREIVPSSSDEEILIPLSGHNSITPSTWDTSSAGTFDDNRSTSTGGEFSVRKSRKARRRSIGSSCGSFGDSGAKQDSETSLYYNDYMNEDPKPSRRHRSRSVDRITPSGSSDSASADLLQRLRVSEKEVSRLLKLTSDQHDTIDDTEKELKKLKKKLKQANVDKEDLADEIDRLSDELDKKERLLQEERKKPKPQETNNNRGNSGSDRLVAQICELKQKKLQLEKQMEEEQSRADSKLEAKEAEIEFLQEELVQMRSKQGDRQLQQQMRQSGSSDEEDTSNHRRPRKNIVGKILSNHRAGQAETQAQLQQQEIRDLQDRVCQLQLSNERLKEELAAATLTIKDDDDAEMRMAKEAAALAVSCHKPQTGLQRGTSLGDRIPQSFRMQRRGSNSGGGVIPDGHMRMQRRMSNPDQVWWGR